MANVNVTVRMDEVGDILPHLKGWGLPLATKQAVGSRSSSLMTTA